MRLCSRDCAHEIVLARLCSRDCAREIVVARLCSRDCAREIVLVRLYKCTVTFVSSASERRPKVAPPSDSRGDLLGELKGTLVRPDSSFPNVLNLPSTLVGQSSRVQPTNATSNTTTAISPPPVAPSGKRPPPPTLPKKGGNIQLSLWCFIRHSRT